VGACGSYAQWLALPTVPPMFGKPALKYNYRFVNPNSAMFTTSPATLGGIGGSTTMWTEGTICLDPHLAGRPETVTFQLQQPSPTTCPTSTESVLLDDLSVVDEPNCP